MKSSSSFKSFKSWLKRELGELLTWRWTVPLVTLPFVVFDILVLWHGAMSPGLMAVSLAVTSACMGLGLGSALARAQSRHDAAFITRQLEREKIALDGWHET